MASGQVEQGCSLDTHDAVPATFSGAPDCWTNRGHPAAGNGTLSDYRKNFAVSQYKGTLQLLVHASLINISENTKFQT